MPEQTRIENVLDPASGKGVCCVSPYRRKPKFKSRRHTLLRKIISSRRVIGYKSPCDRRELHISIQVVMEGVRSEEEEVE